MAGLAMATLAACAEVPDLPASQAALLAPYPALLPLDTLPSAAVPPQDAAAVAQDLDARAAALRARAAALTAADG